MERSGLQRAPGPVVSMGPHQSVRSRASEAGVARVRAFNTVEPFLYLLPSLFFLSVFTYYPMVRSLYYSLYRWNIASGRPVFNGLNNYVHFFRAELFWKVLRNNLVYSIGTISISLAVALLLAVMLNRAIRLVSFYRLAVFYPTMIPMAGAAMIWAWLLAPGYGLVNYYMIQFGLTGIAWLTTEPYALYALMIVGIWKNVGYYSIILLAGLQNIPSELHEAAIVEGASPWQRFRQVTFPLLTPTVFFVFVMAVILSFQSIDQVYLMTQGGPANSTNLLVYYIWQHGFLFWDIGLASTLTTLLLLVLLGFTVLSFRLLEPRIHYGE